ncbi:MAG TPA: CHC2 zinc finger domain-containing protein [Hyphomicrobiaceae bacterium]|nr:CHC2 zinc finger domain-containing protein [Hyphomicrobiaceae bacterium]
MSKFDVDFPHVRKNGDIVAVLTHYGVKLEGDGVQRKALCPFHEEKRPSFNVNVEKRLFHCFACAAKGNVIDFVQQIDPEMKNPRRAAKQVAELSSIATNQHSTASTTTAPPKPATTTPAAPVEKPEVVPAVEAEPGSTATDDATGDGVLVNRALSFELKLEPVVAGGTDPVHTFIADVGLTPERLSALGIGMAMRATMKDRLAIPIYNKDRELVAYCGRHVGPPLADKEPKYKFPANFRKEFELYGWDVAQNFEWVVLVESFLTVIKHGGVAAEAGFGIASVMGTSISDRQVALLLETRPHIIVCFDGDEAGKAGSVQVATALTQAGLWTVVRNCAPGRKPHHDDSLAFCERHGVD